MREGQGWEVLAGQAIQAKAGPMVQVLDILVHPEKV
jgi:hypothetical protein